MRAIHFNLLLHLIDAGQSIEAVQVVIWSIDSLEHLVLVKPLSHYRDDLRKELHWLADLHSMLPGERFHDPELALKLAQWAVELNPEDDMARQSLGWACIAWETGRGALSP